ncbi:hypothetical protein EOM71_02685, partial [Candidatus Falkowbacteria bacterium]|nr:hypothetical protein [Candidatus Falkowbacteria bacterium]
MNCRPYLLAVYLLLLVSLATASLPVRAAQINSINGNNLGTGLITDTGDTIETKPNTSTITSTISTVGSVSPDAIAIRIFDNSNNLSPRAWYNQNIGARRSL